MTASDDHSPFDDQSIKRWEVVGYTDDGAEIAEDSQGRRWITPPIFEPEIGPLSFTDEQLAEFLDTTIASADPEDRRWDRMALGSYFGITFAEADELFRQMGWSSEVSVTREQLFEMINAGYVDSGPVGYWSREVIASWADHVWVPVDLAALALEIDPAAFELLVERAEHAAGIPHAVVTDLPGVGRRIDITATRSQLELSGKVLARVLGSSDAQRRIALIKSLRGG